MELSKNSLKKYESLNLDSVCHNRFPVKAVDKKKRKNLNLIL